MQYAFFTIPINNSEEEKEELNRFLRGHKILSVEKQLVVNAEHSLWVFCVEFFEGSLRLKNSSFNRRRERILGGKSLVFRSSPWRATTRRGGDGCVNAMMRICDDAGNQKGVSPRIFVFVYKEWLMGSG